jgi:ribonuclease Z
LVILAAELVILAMSWQPADRDALEEDLGTSLAYSDFIAGGKWEEVHEVLRPIYQQATEGVGREFPYPEPEGE